MAIRRLHLSRQDFNQVMSDRSSMRATGAHFSVTFSRQGVGTAVVVSKKIAKSSVQRHLVKRRVREAVAPWCADSYGLIVYARAGSASLPYAEIVAELAPLLQRMTS